MDSPAYISIEHAVHSYLNELGDYNLDNYDRMLQIVIEGYTQLNIHHVISLRSAYLTVNDKNIVKFPIDMIDYWEISLVIEGKKWSLSRNNEIAIPNQEVCGIEVGNDSLLEPIEDPDYLDYTQGGTWNIGKLTVDKKRRLIFFEGEMMGKEIFLEYISTGISMSEKTFLPVEILPVIKSYLNWILVERSKFTGLGEKERSRQLYNLALYEWVQFKNSFTFNEALDAIRSGYSAGPKR